MREVAELTADDELLRIAELPEVPVSLENCRRLDPQTRVVIFSRLDVSPAETPRWRRIPSGGIPPRRGPTSIVFYAGVTVLVSRSTRFRTGDTGTI
jgi:hypothetical protein